MIGTTRTRAVLLAGTATLRKFLWRRFLDLAALSLVSAGVIVVGMLISYSDADPSRFVAPGQYPVQNWFGEEGAWLAAELQAWMGVASWVVALALLCWGWHLFQERRIRRPLLRFLALVLGLALLTLLDSVLAGEPSMVGGLLLSAILLLLGSATTDAAWFPMVIVSGAGLVALAILPFGSALRAADFRELRTSFLYVLFHVLHRLNRIRTGSSRTPSPSATRTRSPRRAPTFRKRTPPAKSRQVSERQGTLDLPEEGEFRLPPLNLLKAPDRKTRTVGEGHEDKARLLEATLNDYRVSGQIGRIAPGPVVTRYEFEPAPGIRASRVIGLSDDIARSMSAASARIAVVPNRNVIGIELPNSKRETVYLRELLASHTFTETGSKLRLALGKDIAGTPVITDLTKMPHLLIAGTTGSGKSVAVNAMILSLLYRMAPDAVRLILIDPKVIELSVYKDIPHLLHPVVTDPKKAVAALRWAVREMNARYETMSLLGVRGVSAYNQKVVEAQRTGSALIRTVQTGIDPETGKPLYERQVVEPRLFPFVVIVVDEMADLMLTAGREFERLIQALSQKARAAGIHLVVATQRPSVDVITGTIKSNLPCRISFKVSSAIDSRTVLGEPGAEQLLGQGDMLYLESSTRAVRVHGPFVSDQEVEKVVTFLRSQGQPEYVHEVTEDPEDAGQDTEEGGDALYRDAVALVVRERKVSTSFIQRQFQIGYNRAARIVEQMESDGVVSPANHTGRREVLQDGEGR